MLALLSLLLVACAKQQEFVTISTGKEAIKVNVELARTEAEVEKGLMFRTSLPENSGMLFIFPDEAERFFWMKNTKIPLDMVFIAADGKIVSIQENVQPCTAEPCPIYPSGQAAQFVLEVNSNFAKKNNITIGSRVNIK